MTLLPAFPQHRPMTLPADQTWPASGKWTYEDYCRIPNDGRLYEIIEGDLYMSPVPLIKHQRARGNLSARLCSFVEILSPWNWHIDRGQKAKVYAQAGVREYWIVDPDAETVDLFVLHKGAFVLAKKYGVGETVRSEVLAGLKVKVKEVCEW
jgi:Uma2 family endonuclease